MIAFSLAAFVLPFLQDVAPAAGEPWGGAHARLHPNSATLFVEFADIPLALAAYEDAAVVRMWNDAEFQEALEKLVPGSAGIFGPASEAGWSVAKFEQDLLENGSWPFSVGPLALGSQLRAMSLSLRLPELPAHGSVPLAPALLAARVGVQVVLEFSDRDQAEEVARALAAFAQERASGEAPLDDFDASEPVLWRLADGAALLGLVAWSRADGPRVVWALGDPEFQAPAYGARAGDGEVPRFADRADVGAAHGALGSGTGTTLLQGWQRESPLESLLAFTPLLSALPNQNVIPEGLVETLSGLSGFAPGLLSVFLGPTGTGAFRTLLGPGGFTGQFAGPVPPGERWYGGQPVPQAGLRHVPEQATALWSAHVHGPSAASALRALLVEQLDGGASALEALEADGSFDLERDLFAHLGPDAALYLRPLTGLGVPGAVLSIAVHDQDAVASALSRLLGSLAAANPESLAFRERPYRRLPYFELSAVGELAESLPLESEVALGLAHGRLIVSLPVGQAAVVAKREMRDLVERAEAAQQPSTPDAPPKAAPASFDTSVLGLTEVDETIWFLDWPGAIGRLYGTAKALSGMAAGFLGDDMPVNLAALPEPELLVRHLLATSIRTRVQGDFALREVKSGFGPEVPLALAGAVVYMGLGTQSEWDVPVETIPEVDAGADAEDPARAHEETRRALQRVRSGLGVWAAFHDGRYPDSLAALTESTDVLPNGVFNGEPLPLDGWGQNLSYRAHEGGFALWSVGANGEDEGGAGDDVQL